MKAIVTVIGKDKTGIIARVSALLYEAGANIEDISQTIMQDYFSMIMLVDLSGAAGGIVGVSERLTRLGAEIGVSVRVQHEDIFNIMHKV